MISKNPRRKAGGRLDVTFADEVCEVAETPTTYMKQALETEATLSYKLIPAVETDHLA